MENDSSPPVTKGPVEGGGIDLGEGEGKGCDVDLPGIIMRHMISSAIRELGSTTMRRQIFEHIGRKLTPLIIIFSSMFILMILLISLTLFMVILVFLYIRHHV